MVFKPLCVGRQLFGAFGRCQVLEIDQTFPRSLHAERIAIAFGETIHEVNQAFGVFEPKDAVVVEGAEVAGAVILDEFADDGLLLLAVGKGQGGFEMLHDAFEGGGVESADAVDAFIEKTELVAHEARVEPHHHRPRVGGGLALGVELFGFGLRDAGCIVVAGTGEHKVVAVFLIDAHRHHLRVENHGEDFLFERVAHLFQGGAQPRFGKFGDKLFATIVVVDAAREPHALQIGSESLKIAAAAVALVVLIDRFEHFADAEVVASVLVEKDVTSGQCGLGEVIDKRFLLKVEAFKAFHLVAQHLDVGKLLIGVAESVVLRCGGLGSRAQCRER